MVGLACCLVGQAGWLGGWSAGWVARRVYVCPHAEPARRRDDDHLHLVAHGLALTDRGRVGRRERGPRSRQARGQRARSVGPPIDAPSEQPVGGRDGRARRVHVHAGTSTPVQGVRDVAARAVQRQQRALCRSDAGGAAAFCRPSASSTDPT